MASNITSNLNENENIGNKRKDSPLNEENKPENMNNYNRKKNRLEFNFWSKNSNGKSSAHIECSSNEFLLIKDLKLGKWYFFLF